MNRLAEVLPEFATEVAAALESEGFGHLRQNVLEARIERWTFDPTVKCGYIYLVQATPLHHSEESVAKTVAFATPHWFNVDLRMDGDIFGIELLGRREEIERLSASGAP